MRPRTGEGDRFAGARQGRFILAGKGASLLVTRAAPDHVSPRPGTARATWGILKSEHETAIGARQYAWQNVTLAAI